VQHSAGPDTSAPSGFLVVASPAEDFPTPTDRLMLGVAANQAAIVLQQRRSQDRVRRSEQELSDFFDNATIGLHWVGPDGTIIRANRAELDLLGYTAEEYLGHHIAEFHADAHVIEDLLQRLWAGREVRDHHGSGDQRIAEAPAHFSRLTRVARRKAAVASGAGHVLILAFLDHWLGQRPVSEAITRAILDGASSR